MKGNPALYDKTYTAYQLQRSGLRKWLRRLWLNNVLKHVNGKAIDFGCGVGELLRLLPPGSIGVEVNEASALHCRSLGLDVHKYDPKTDNYRLSGIAKEHYQVFVISHVLEHLERPDDALRQILASCKRLGIRRIIIVIPGKKGYKFDKTHRTFIDRSFFDQFEASPVPSYRITRDYYFPVNMRWIGNYFTYHELVVIFDQSQEATLSMKL